MKALLNPAAMNIALIAHLGTVEFASILAHRFREGSLTKGDYGRIRNDFTFHCYHEYQLVGMSLPVFSQARRLVETHPLRALDSLQLACAINATRYAGDQPIFVSADQRLLAAAAAEGLPTDDPNAHP